MILTADDPRAERTIVLLEGKPVKSWLAAESGEKGWIEVIDISTLAPLDMNEGTPGQSGDHEVRPVVMPTKKIEGHVEFRTLKLPTQ